MPLKRELAQLFPNFVQLPFCIVAKARDWVPRGQAELRQFILLPVFSLVPAVLVFEVVEDSLLALV